MLEPGRKARRAGAQRWQRVWTGPAVGEEPRSSTQGPPCTSGVVTPQNGANGMHLVGQGGPHTCTHVHLRVTGMLSSLQNHSRAGPRLTASTTRRESPPLRQEQWSRAPLSEGPGGSGKLKARDKTMTLTGALDGDPEHDLENNVGRNAKQTGNPEASRAEAAENHTEETAERNPCPHAPSPQPQREPAPHHAPRGHGRPRRWAVLGGENARNSSAF